MSHTWLHPKRHILLISKDIRLESASHRPIKVQRYTSYEICRSNCIRITGVANNPPHLASTIISKRPSALAMATQYMCELTKADPYFKPRCQPQMICSLLTFFLLVCGRLLGGAALAFPGPLFPRPLPPAGDFHSQHCCCAILWHPCRNTVSTNRGAAWRLRMHLLSGLQRPCIYHAPNFRPKLELVGSGDEMPMEGKRIRDQQSFLSSPTIYAFLL